MLVAYLGFNVFLAHHVHLFSFGPIPSSLEMELPSTRQFPEAQGEQLIPGSHCHSSRRGNTKFTSTMERQTNQVAYSSRDHCCYCWETGDDPWSPFSAAHSTQQMPDGAPELITD